ncbi:hypothetical protein O6H91_07G122200 [Diphasiastrum complanatum]|uniref:Uncharacterized protein n=2 Tax=Diphasiastrum complanatum TaxID=34168 RepID=A0ACC2D9H0_DIPCM|nr:hypothetical protein O6H91_07G115200 [Diphasiastrum complanatum]KAJ7550863.1 hypothetical protein O6H91_07G122200 [Diphasiastrum complanatum]
MAPKTNSKTIAKPLCLCSPTSHAGSFRCRLHRSSANRSNISQPSEELISLEKNPNVSLSAGSKVLQQKNNLENVDTRIKGGRALISFAKLPWSNKPATDNFNPKPSRLCKVVYAADTLEEDGMLDAKISSLMSDRLR